jgi:replication factor C small subunit
MVFKITGKIHPEEIRSMISAALGKDLGTAVSKLDDFLHEYGLSGRNIVSQAHTEIYNMDIAERKKLEVVKIFADTEYRLSQGGTEEVQLNAMLSKISLL